MCGGLGQIPEPIRIDTTSGRRARGQTDNAGCAAAFLGLLLIAGLVIVGGGYVLSSEIVWNYWSGGKFTEHRWDRVAIYAASSLSAVALVARYFGFLIGAAVGIIPALPLYHATKGDVGFWFIVLHGEKDPLGNVVTSWIALTGMLAIHWALAGLVQHRKEPFLERLLRWRWIGTPAGIVSSVLLAGACLLATSIVNQAIRAF